MILTFSINGFSTPKKPTYIIEIIQNGELIPLKKNVVELEKKEFQIRVTLNNQKGVFMIPSFNSDYFDLKPKEEIKDYKWLNQKTVAETKFNADQELIIENETVCYLFYDETLDWHRFDKGPIINEKTVIGTKTIKQIFNNHTKEVTPIEHVDKDIYLFFVATEEWGKGETPKELGRFKIQIKWK